MTCDRKYTIYFGHKVTWCDVKCYIKFPKVLHLTLKFNGTKVCSFDESAFI